LNKNIASNHRRDFIETEYVNGVRDPETGEKVIRPLNKEEKDWLAKFYQESEHTNFVKTDELDTAEKLLKNLRKEHKQYKKDFEVEHPAVLRQLAKVEYLREEAGSLFPEEGAHTEIRRQDYVRKMDIYNISKSNGMLVSLDVEEYDKFTSEKMEDAEIKSFSYANDTKERR
jgi:hypothetical protein